MLDNQSWLRLIDGLITATKSGRLEWDASDRRSKMSVIASAPAGGLPSAQLFSAQVDGAHYELSSEDPRGRAPYALLVREISRPGKLKLIGELRSSVEISDGQTMRLNSSLEQLYRVVDSTVEPPSAVVSRLLRGLGI